MAHRSSGRSTDGFSLSFPSSDFRRTAVRTAALSMFLAASGGVWAQPAASVTTPQSAARDYDIPAGALSPALSRFAGQSGVTLSSGAALTDGRSTQGLHGRHGVTEGFAQLLRDTGLDAVQVGAGTFVLRAAAVPAAAANTAPSDAYTLREVRVTGTRVRDGETEGTGSYTTEAITIGKTAQALREHPQSVSVITRQRLEDQNITSLAQAATQAPGITVQDTNGYISALYSRGFAINSYQLDGGAPLDTGFAASLSMDLTQYDRVEVLRGAAGLLNGTGNPGGALNLVRKMPTATPQFNVALSAGRWDNYRTEVDASGPLAFDGKLRGRAVLAYENRKYFIDHRASEKPFFYGVLEADIGPDAVLALGARDQGVHERGSFVGLPRYSTGADLGLPRSAGTVAPWSGVTGSSQEVFAKLTWRLAPRWTLRANATRARQEGHNTDAFTLGAIDPQTLAGSRWQNGYTESTNTQTLLDVNLSGAFDAFGRTHEVLLGVDAQDVRSRWAAKYRLEGNGSPADIFNMGSNFFPASGYGPFERIYDPWAQRQYGAYGTLRLALSDATRLIVGARANKYKYRQIYRELDTDIGDWSVTGHTQYSEPAKVTPFAGVVFDIDSQWSAYASYAQIFKPQADYKAGPAPGTGLKPMRGSNAEVGVKGNLLDGKVNTALALYRIVQDGRALEDPRYDGETAVFSSNCCYLASGKVISQGIDTEISGEVARGVNLHAGYTYNSNRDKTANAAFSTITPRHSLKFWGTWHLPGEAGRWLVGGGATVQSTQYVSGTAATYDAVSGKFNGPSVPFRYTQGGYAVWNAMAQYRIDPRWTVTFNLNNVFDKRYYRTVAGANLGNFYGEPRNAMVTLRGKF
jgi:outer membrane receptor for ferric coprogen and ferric-rhodotorulic acid